MAEVFIDGLQVGRGGWCRFWSRRVPWPLYVRFVAEPDGRLVLSELYVPPTGGAKTATAMAAIPYGVIEQYANAPDVRPSVLARIGEAGVDLHALASHFGSTFGAQVTGKPVEKQHWVIRWYEAAHGRAPAAPLVRERPSVEPMGEVDAKVDVPGCRPYPDGFYKDVAMRYGKLAAQGTAPAPAIATASGVPVTTVHRWIKEARRRGILPPGRRGRTG